MSSEVEVMGEKGGVQNRGGSTRLARQLSVSVKMMEYNVCNASRD